MPISIFWMKILIRKISKNKIGRFTRRGITLIELVVVMFLISFLIVFLATSLPNFIKTSSFESAEAVEALLNFSSRFAVLNNVQTKLIIDMDTRKIKAVALNESEKGLEEKVLKSITLPESSRVIKIIDIRGLELTKGIVEIPFSFNYVSEDYIIGIGDDEVKTSLLNFKYNNKIVKKTGEVLNFENQ